MTSDHTPRRVVCLQPSATVPAKPFTPVTVQATGNGRRIRTAVVCGAGPAGLLFIQYLRRVVGLDGLILVIEPNAKRRALAERFGAETIDPAATDAADVVRERTNGRGAELVIEASGSGPAFAGLPRLIRKQATVLLYGHGHAGVELSVLNLLQFMEPRLVAPAGASGGFEPTGRPSVCVRALRLSRRRGSHPADPWSSRCAPSRRQGRRTRSGRPPAAGRR